MGSKRRRPALPVHTADPAPAPERHDPLEDQALPGHGGPVSHGVAPPAGPPPADPLDPVLLAAAERSLGRSLDVEVRTGDGVAEAHGAAAMTRGRTVHVADAAIGPDGRAEPGLMAHELVHVAQQAAPLPASSDVDLEAEADAGAQAILGGRATTLRGSTGGRTPVQRLTFAEWFRRVATGDASTETHTVADDRTHTPETFYGTSTPIPAETPYRDDGRYAPTAETAVSGRHVTVSAAHDGLGATATATETVHDGPDTASLTASTSVSLRDGTHTRSFTARLTQDQGIDAAATAERVAQALRDRADGLQVRADALDERLRNVDAAMAQARSQEDAARQRVIQTLSRGGTAPSTAAVDAALLEDPAWRNARFGRRRLEAERRTLQRERDDLLARRQRALADADRVTPDNAAAIAATSGVHVEAVRAAPQVAERSGRVTRDLDVLGGAFTTTRTDTASTRNALGSQEITRTRSDRIAIDGGIRHTRTASQREAASGEAAGGDDTSFATERTTSSFRGAVVGPDGEVGVQGGRSSTSATTRVEAGRRTHFSSTRERAWSVSDRGGTMRGARAFTAEGDHLSSTTRVSADGKVAVTCTKISDTPPKYALEVVLRIGGTVALGLDGQTHRRGDAAPATGARGNAGISGSAGASVQLTYRHELAREDAARYLDALSNYERGRPTGGSAPEFDLLDRMTLLGDDIADGAVGHALSAFGSAGSREIAPGTSYELLLTGEARVDATAGATRGATAGTLGGGMDWQSTRRIRIGAIDDPERGRLTTVTVAFASRDGWNASGSLTIGAAGMTAGRREQDTSGLSYTFHLDPKRPDYDRVYDAIVGAGSREALRNLEKDPRVIEHRVGVTTRTGESATDTVGVTAGPAGVGLEITRAYDASVTADEDGLSGTFTGSETAGGSVSLGGVTLHQDSVRTSGSATVRPDGALSVELSQTETSTSILNLGDARAIADDRSWAERLLAQNPRASLEREIRNTLTRIWGFTLDEKALDTVIRRAGDTSNWDRCAQWQNAEDTRSWQALGRRLRNPLPDPEWVEVDRVRAERLDQARIIARFMQATGDAGLSMFRACLREWGEDWRNYQLGAEDVGMLFEWPESLQETRSRYRSIEDRHATMDERIAAFLARGDAGQAEGLQWCDRFQTDLDEVYEAIRNAPDFRIPRARIEMLERLDTFRNDLIGARQRLLGGEAVTDPETEATIAAMQLADRRERLKVRLRQYKRDQDRLLATARATDWDTRFEDATTFSETLATLFSSRPEEDGHIYLSRCWDLQLRWIDDILALRNLYRESRIDERDWVVSTGPGQPRNLDYEPDHQEINRLWLLFTWDKYAARRDNARREEAYRTY